MGGVLGLVQSRARAVETAATMTQSRPASAARVAAGRLGVLVAATWVAWRFVKRLGTHPGGCNTLASKSQGKHSAMGRINGHRLETDACPSPNPLRGSAPNRRRIYSITKWETVASPPTFC